MTSPRQGSLFSVINPEFFLTLVHDLTRNLLRVLLYIAVIVSAFSVIMASHHNRQENIELEDLMQQRDELDVEWRNLVLEQRALTEHNRIEAMVEKQLDMHRPSADKEVVVRIK